MNNIILLVFEGERTERLIWNSLHRFHLNDAKSPVVYGIYGGEIYSLFHKMEADPDLDLFSLIKEDYRNAGLLDGVLKDQVSEIYLFFDYDGHAPAATDEKLLKMLTFFNEETENGKLYLSYPMVESLRHLHPDVPFDSLSVECKLKVGYKGIVVKESLAAYHDVTIYTDAQWAHVLLEHCKKLNSLMVGQFSFPAEYFDQSSVFKQQLDRFIVPESKVSVLSAFPIFLLDYYGCAAFDGRLAGVQV